MATIYRNGQKFAGTGSSTASQVILSSALHIGGETQINAEDAVHALSESGGGASSLADLSNVDIKNPQDGDMLYYDSINFMWTNNPLKIVTWADGTDREIARMLEAYYNNEINIYNYWTVGDERIVHLNAMSRTGVGESHVAQDVKMVLMNEGGKTLITPINEKIECAFIVGQKNLLANGTTLEGGYMNSSDTNNGGWNSCARRTWCNSVYKNALPSTLVGIFKEHQNITASGSSSATATSDDYFALPSEKEIFGTATYANPNAEVNNTQFKYYETSSNRIKYRGETGGSAYSWWERSPYSGNTANFCCVYTSGDVNYNSAAVAIGLAPFGVI